MITTQDIEKLATLSRLKLTDEEKGQFQKEIGSILSYIDQIKKASGNIKEESIVSDHINIMRDDVVTRTKGEYTEELLKLAPKRDGNFVKVKKIL